MSYRIIPRLDIKGPNLVKGIHLEGLRVLGKPWDFAMKYYQDGADELIYVDVVASLYGRNSLKEFITKTAEQVFIPFTVVGGVRTIEDIADILQAGADKVGINTAGINNPDLLEQGAKTFGSQCIVCSIEAKRVDDNYLCFTDNGREWTGKNVYDWAREAVDRGVGEILLTSIDFEGTGRGFDLELTQKVADMVPVPVVACGGCGQPEHLVQAVCDGHADAISCASIFHYTYLAEQVDLNEFTSEGNIEFIKQYKSGQNFLAGRMARLTIPDVKRVLRDAGYQCRA